MPSASFCHFYENYKVASLDKLKQDALPKSCRQRVQIITLWLNTSFHFSPQLMQISRIQANLWNTTALGNQNKQNKKNFFQAKSKLLRKILKTDSGKTGSLGYLNWTKTILRTEEPYASNTYLLVMDTTTPSASGLLCTIAVSMIYVQTVIWFTDPQKQCCLEQ